MQKDFDGWNAKKKALDGDVSPRVFVHERELWFANLGVNIGFEQDGRGAEAMRPILVIRKFNNEVLWGIPLTRTEKPNNPYYHTFPYTPSPEHENGPLRHSTVILSQLRLIDAKRLRYKIGTISRDAFEIVKEKTRQLLV
jgi:mRNA interferase MazF